MDNKIDNVDSMESPKVGASPDISKKTILKWEAPSFQKGEQSTKWYLVAGAVILALILYSVWQEDWFAIVIIVVISAVLFWHLRANHPTNINYQVTPMGILADEKLYPFNEIHSFWIVYNDKVKTLQIVFKKKYLPTLVIGIDSVEPLLLKSYLLRKIPEQEDRGEALVDKLIRVLRL